MKKKEPNFCSNCRAKLVWVQDWAEKHIENGYSETKFKKFNPITGERQVVGWYQCPKKRWWNSHDSYEWEAKVV